MLTYRGLHPSKVSMKPNRLQWSKIPVPFELSDMLYMVAKAKGYKREQIHFFLYDLLKSKYADDVEHLATYLETHWLDDKPTSDD
jgi:hypothetical protein